MLTGPLKRVVIVFLTTNKSHSDCHLSVAMPTRSIEGDVVVSLTTVVNTLLTDQQESTVMPTGPLNRVVVVFSTTDKLHSDCHVSVAMPTGSLEGVVVVSLSDSSQHPTN